LRQREANLVDEERHALKVIAKRRPRLVLDLNLKGLDRFLEQE